MDYMAQLVRRITDADGITGDILSSSDAGVRVDAGSLGIVQLRPDQLRESYEGQLSTDVRFADAASLSEVEEQEVIAIGEERLSVEKRQRETGRVRVSKLIDTVTETVDEPLLQETVDVEHVPVGQVVKAAPQPREEGDTLIIPVVEERLVVRKELFLREEIHVRRRRSEHHEPVEVSLRKERVEVERLPGGEADEGAPTTR